MAPKRPSSSIASSDDGDAARKKPKTRAVLVLPLPATPTAVEPAASTGDDVIGYAVAKNLKFRTYIAASYWLEQGCPRMDFLSSLGLQSLADVKWNITSAALIREFVANYNLISERFKLSYEGVLSFKRSFDNSDQVKLFKDGAYQKDLGFRHDMLVDLSLAPIFSLIAEVVQLRVSSGYTSRNLIEIITQGLQGYKVNWSEYMFQNILKELRRMKQKSHTTVVFGAGPLITHIYEGFEGEEASSEPLVEIKSPVPTINPAPRLELATVVLQEVPISADKPVAIPLATSHVVDAKCAVDAIDLNSSSAITKVRLVKPVTAQFTPAKSAFTAPPPPPPPPPLPSLLPPPEISNTVYGVSPKTKLTSLLSEATKTLGELYSEEEVQKRVNQMLNVTTGQLNFERMIRERTEEELKEAKKLSDQYKAELTIAHIKITQMEKKESQMKDALEKIEKAKKDLEDDLENYGCMIMEHQENLAKLQKESETVTARLENVESNFADIKKQVDDASRRLSEKNELLKRTRTEEQQLEDLQGAVTLLRTELAAKELSFDEVIWEKIKETARKYTHEEYAKLVDTIAHLQEQLDKQQARQAGEEHEED